MGQGVGVVGFRGCWGGGSRCGRVSRCHSIDQLPKLWLLHLDFLHSKVDCGAFPQKLPCRFRDVTSVLCSVFCSVFEFVLLSTQHGVLQCYTNQKN